MDELGEKGYQKCILDDWDGALAIWDEAIRRYPKEKRFYNNRALCHFHRKEYRRALADAHFMTQHFPDYVRGHFREGEVLCVLERYEEAYKSYRKVISLDPSCSEALNELAEVQIRLLCKKGFTRYQAACALSVAKDLKEAEALLYAGAISPQDSEFYFSEDEDTGPGPLSIYEDPSNPKKLKTLWIGNMTEKMTDSQVANLFKGFGEVVSAKHYPESICAFVNFAHYESASKAMKALQGTDLAGNKKIILRWPAKLMDGSKS